MRIRTIKPEFWGHELLAKTSEFTRLLAIALLNYADDEGYFLASPQSIRGAVFPFEDDSRKIHGALMELSNLGYVRLGKLADGRAVGHVVKFSEHQVINRAQSSKLKASSSFTDDSLNTHGTITAGMEGKGMERNPPLIPQGGDAVFSLSAEAGEPEPPKQKKEWTPTAEQQQVNRWFGRKDSTPWSDKELRAWHRISAAVIADGLEALNGYYSQPLAVAQYRRRDPLTLLNNWTGEIDRWRGWKPGQQARPANGNHRGSPERGVYTTNY